VIGGVRFQYPHGRAHPFFDGALLVSVSGRSVYAAVFAPSVGGRCERVLMAAVGLYVVIRRCSPVLRRRSTDFHEMRCASRPTDSPRAEGIRDYTFHTSRWEQPVHYMCRTVRNFTSPRTQRISASLLIPLVQHHHAFFSAVGSR